MSLWRMNDAAPDGMFEVHPSEAHAWNKKGHGVFWTVNTFAGPRRISNLIRIDFWAIDIDDGTKAQQSTRIHRGLEPTRIVETKRGFQVYWRARNATAGNWNAVMVDRLVPFYGADQNARDLARVLRAPGYLHMKNPVEPFLVREVYSSGREYTEAQMLAFYPERKKPEPPRTPLPAAIDETVEKRAERAAKYLARIDGAVSGQGGHDQTFDAALVLVKGFALPEHVALDLLERDFNPRCDPRWSQKELRHKVKSAANSRLPAGYKLERRM